MSNRDIFLWLMGSLIAVGILVWTAIYVMDHYLFAETRSVPSRAVVTASATLTPHPPEPSATPSRRS
jgi:hypothetical protein